MDEIQVLAQGPLFDGCAEAQVLVFLVEAEDLVAKAAEEAVDHNLAASIRHPSSPPFYQSQIHTVTREANLVVNDTGVIYGPWLEGVGSRNKTTRFKGYFSFRRARQAVDERKLAIMAPAVARFVAELQR